MNFEVINTPLIENDMFQGLVEYLNEGVASLTPDGRVSYSNLCLANQLNLPREQLTGRNFIDLVIAEDRPKFLELMNKATLRTCEADLRCMRYGEPVPVRLFFTANPLPTGDLSELISLVVKGNSGDHPAGESFRRIQKSYEQRVSELSGALEKANEELVQSQGAYLNMMQDIVDVNRNLKRANKKLISQSKKRKKAEKMLKKSEKMFRTLLNASPEAIFKLDLEYVIDDISQVTTEIFGFQDKEEMLGKSFFDLVIPGEQERINDVFNTALSKGLIRNTETILLKKDKSGFTADISLTVIEKGSGKPKAFMAIIRDITLKKKIDLQLIQNARLVSLGEMATGIAHEINQPLNTISLSLDNFLYEVNKLESIDKGYFQAKSDKIFDNIYRIRNIIEHVRDFSRYQDHHQLVAFDLHKSITNAISMISEEFKFREINLITDFEQTDSHVLGNVYKFEEVILNLLTNCKDALEERKKTTPEPPRSYVKIHTFSQGEFIFVAVEDNGNGIKAGDMDKVLLPFFSTKEEGKGTGLGLSISYGIIKEMNGTFEVQSKWGVGTTMLIRLPVEKRLSEFIPDTE
jgi:PAS domain S-box-containing protein